MAGNELARLASAGMIERRSRSLKVTHRFLAHAEMTASRMRSGARKPTEQEILAVAVGTWPDFRGNPLLAAYELGRVMDERNQFGAIRPAFPITAA